MGRVPSGPGAVERVADSSAESATRASPADHEASWSSSVGEMIGRSSFSPQS
jgi:hypothetical protein